MKLRIASKIIANRESSRYSAHQIAKAQQTLDTRVLRYLFRYLWVKRSGLRAYGCERREYLERNVACCLKSWLGIGERFPKYENILELYIVKQ